MRTLWLDTETYSPISLRAAGLYRYAEEVEVMVVSFAIDDGPVHVWDVTTGTPMPDDLDDALHDPSCRIVAHNAQFDRTVTRELFWSYDIPIKRWRCTMVRAYSNGLPGALADLSAVMGVADEEKKGDGRALINTFCMPNSKSGKRTMPKDDPEAWGRFLKYAAGDIVAMRAVCARMPLGCWSKEELWVWHLDQKINDRGFLVDGALARGALAETGLAAAQNKRDVEEATVGEVTSVGQRDKLLTHILAAYGVPLPDLKKATLEKRVEDPDLPDEVKELIRLRLNGSKSSVTKYKAILAALSTDGRLRGSLQYGGANRTLRWSGRRFQPQNLPRPTMKADEIEAGIAMLQREEAWLDYDVMTLASNALRGLLVAPEGKKLVVSDLANIEGRVAAWVAGEEWKLSAFRQYDAGIGPDLYVATYARSFDLDMADVDKDMRQVGKVIELACGYQGAVNAFQSMAALYRVEVTDEHALQLVLAWRRAHPKIVGIWRLLEDGVRMAKATGKEVPVGKVKIKWTGEWLTIALPSGRKLSYPKPNINDAGKVEFGSVNRYTKKWEQQSTYGGKIFENIVQAIARDVLTLGMRAGDANGYDIVLHVHDELVTEADDDNTDFSAGALSVLMAEGADWTEGLPLAAKGFSDYRYRKGD